MKLGLQLGYSGSRLALPIERMRLAERYRAWAGSGITGLTGMTEQAEPLELMARPAA